MDDLCSALHCQWRSSESLWQKWLLCSVTVAKMSFFFDKLSVWTINHIRTAVHGHLTPNCLWGRLPNRISFDFFARCFCKVKTSACETQHSCAKGLGGLAVTILLGASRSFNPAQHIVKQQRVFYFVEDRNEWITLCECWCSRPLWSVHIKCYFYQKKNKVQTSNDKNKRHAELQPKGCDQSSTKNVTSKTLRFHSVAKQDKGPDKSVWTLKTTVHGLNQIKFDLEKQRAKNKEKKQTKLKKA